MSGTQTNNEITLSSQPFEPGSNMKRRKTGHGKNQVATSFEEELKTLNADMDIDIQSEFIQDPTTDIC